MRQVPGVGLICSLTYALTLEEPGRFWRSRSAGAYLGLVQRQRQSGEQQPQMHITKAGDVALRSVLVQSAQYILGRYGPDSDLRRWGLKLAGEGSGGGHIAAQGGKRPANLLFTKTGLLMEGLGESRTFHA